MNAKVRTFVLTAGNMDGATMAQVLVKTLPKITKMSATQPAPFIATVSKIVFITILSSKLRRQPWDSGWTQLGF